jgi:hypothetical protein
LVSGDDGTTLDIMKSAAEPPVVVDAETAALPVVADHLGRLPASERNMLIFVALLLALGAMAVIAVISGG